VGQLGRIVQRGLRTTNPSNDLTTHPQQGQPHTQVEEPDSAAASTRPPAYSDSESVSTAREYFSGGSRFRGLDDFAQWSRGSSTVWTFCIRRGSVVCPARAQHIRELVQPVVARAAQLQPWRADAHVEEGRSSRVVL